MNSIGYIEDDDDLGVDNFICYNLTKIKTLCVFLRVYDDVYSSELLKTIHIEELYYG